MFSVTSIFVNLSETMAELGFLVNAEKRWQSDCIRAMQVNAHFIDNQNKYERIHMTDTLLCSMQSLSAAIVAFMGLYLRHRFSISPKAVYRQAMIRLNTHPSVLEVLHHATLHAGS